MTTEGPSLLTWILGRATYPTTRVRCRQCGRGTTDPEAEKRLRDAGLTRVADWSNVCPACKSENLRERLRTAK